MRVLTQDKKNIYDCDEFFVVEGKTQTIGYDPYYRKFSIIGEKDEMFVNLGVYETSEEAYYVKGDLEAHKLRMSEGTFAMPKSERNSNV